MTSRSLTIVVGAAAIAATACTFANHYQQYVIAVVALTAIVGVGLNVLLGLAGQLSLGHAGFYAIGAYACAILTAHHGWSFWLALPLAGLAAAVAGGVLAVPALRVRGPYLAMVTIAFGFVTEQSAAEMRDLTGGWSGIMNIPRPVLFGRTLNELGIALLAIAVLTALLIVFARFRNSTWGLAMRATRDSEVASQAIGLNVVAVRAVAFVVSAFLAGIAGALFAPLGDFISPESFPFFQSIVFLLVVLIGGVGTVLGPVAGAVVVVLLPEALSFLAEYRLLLFGALLLVILRLVPEGIMGAVERRFTRTPPTPPRAAEEDVAAFLAPGPGGSALDIDRLSIAFGGTQAVADVSLCARARQITSIIGPNGAGKTTLLNLISGFYRPDAGTVTLGAERLPAGVTYRIARSGVARTFQTTQLFPRMSVLENVVIAMHKGRLGALHRAAFGGRRRLGLEHVASGLLAFVGYSGPTGRRAEELPHVDRRLVEIARALAGQPQVLLLDEPAAGLDEVATRRIGGLLQRIAAFGIAVVIIEHDMTLVMGVSDQIVALDAGRRLVAGTPAEVRVHADVRAAYLGDGELQITRGARAPGGGGAVLEVRSLATGYGALPVLQGVSIRVDRGELVAVLGANGAGKSTLMRAISGLHRPVEGTVLLLGRAIDVLAAHRIARSGITLVPEGRQVFPELTVADNVLLAAQRLGRRAAQAEVAKQLARFPMLEALRSRRAGLLSGGEQQMLAIARGLASRPHIVLLDEPSLGLAPAIVDALYRVLEQLRSEGVTILLVDQMARLALSIADRAYVLQSGRIVHQGQAAEMQNDEALEKAYLG